MSEECAGRVEQYDRSASFDAGIKLAGLATELGYKVDEYEIVGADVVGDEIEVYFRDVDTGGDE